MGDSTELHELAAIMRRDWNQRALEDAGFYVAFYRRDQPEDAFHESAQDIVKELYPEILRLKSESPEGAFIRALEVGCGPGRLLLPMSRHVDEIHGVDISEEMISLAARRLQDVPHAHVQVNSGYDLAGFPDDHFSLVYSYIVYQHIPSREIILQYLLETRRVLRPGGVTRFQVRGAPPSRASETDSTTWKGCVITDEEIVDFARNYHMELVALSGEGTQYLWITLKKPAARFPGPTLEAVTAAHDGAPTVAQRGRHSGLSLWVRNASEGTDLTSLSAGINGTPVRGCYLSPIGRNGGCQMNVMLPGDVPPGIAEVSLFHQGVISGPPQNIYVEAVELVPRVVAVYDAVNTTLLLKSDSGGIKVLIEDVSGPETIRFRLGDQIITEVDSVCTNRVLGQFLFSLLLPPSLSGPVRLSVLNKEDELFGEIVEISPPPQVLSGETTAESDASIRPESS
jgi:SAM-dependent methyltransferase